MDSNELQTFIQDVRDDLNNLDSLIDYYDFLGHHNIRTIVFNPEDEPSFFEGSVITVLDQRYREFFKSKFNCEIDAIVFAVNIPPQEPAFGHAVSSIFFNSSSEICPALYEPTAS